MNVSTAQAGATAADWETKREAGQQRAATAVTIVIPCLNEEPAIPNLARALDRVEDEFGDAYALEFIFVDDGSVDGTWQALQTAFGDRADCRCMRHARNRGIAAAIRSGLAAARTEIVCSIDSDCTYDPCELRWMVPLLSEGVDLVTASPYHPDGAVYGVPGWRLGLSKGLSRLYRLALGERLCTFTSCFRIYRKSAVETLDLREDGFLGIAELAVRLSLAGGRIAEYPATLRSRQFGQSKLKIGRTILAHLRMLGGLMLLRTFRSGHHRAR